MTTIIFSKGVMTLKKPKQSIRSHIKDHEKNEWIFEYMRIDECDYQTALKAWMEMEAVQK